MEMKRLLPFFLAALLLILLVEGWLEPTRGQPEVGSPPASPEPVGTEASPAREPRSVVRVIDGDTLLLDGRERVRLIGVDTPESVRPDRPQERFGAEASAFTQRMAERKQIWLEYDPQVGRKDDYGRTLAYVYLADGTLLNREIIRQGFGYAYMHFPFSRKKEFRAAEREAREQRRGLWTAVPR